MSYYCEHREEERKVVSDYINSLEDYTVLTETEQVVYDHFKSKYPKLDWILKKRVYSELSDLVNEGTEKFCRYYDDFSEYLDGGIKNNISPYYYKPIFLVGYQNTMFPLYKEEFGDCENTIELHRESSFDITQLESDFFDDLYNYSKDVVETFWNIMEKEGSKYLSEIFDKLYERRLLCLPSSYVNTPSNYVDTGWEDGEFTHPKLQRNWCYKYVGRVSITEIPVTERFVERHKNKELYLDKEKVDFKNITPVFSGRDGSSLSFFKKLNSQKKEEELKVA